MSQSLFRADAGGIRLQSQDTPEMIWIHCLRCIGSGSMYRFFQQMLIMIMCLERKGRAR